MSKITIREVDETTVGQPLIVSTDVAYIPGFSVMTPTDDQIIGEPHVPQLCRTIKEFESYFGASVPTFSQDQFYPEGFAKEAVPTDIGGTPKNMFNKDDPDPSYIYAKELLTLGLPVLYERVNEIGESISVNTMYTALEKIFEKSNDSTLTQLISWAPTYSAAATYAVNDHCRYGDKNYKCKTAIQTAEEWNPAKWEVDPEYRNYNVTVVSDTFYNKMYEVGKHTFVYDSYPTYSAVYSGVKPSAGTASGLVSRMAPEYDPDSSYGVGDHCMYQGNVFENIKATASKAGQFDSSYWMITDWVPTSFVTINKDIWESNTTATVTPGTVYVFAYDEDLAGGPWKLTIGSGAAQPVTLSAYGIKVSGVFNDGDTITITNIANIGWGRNGEYIGETLTDYGITVSVESGGDGLQLEDNFTIYLETLDPMLLDRGLYSFKYLTSGGYPTFEYAGGTISKLMASICYTRGDAVALIDHTDNPARPLTGTTSVYYMARQPQYMLPSAHQAFAAMFTPSVQMTLNSNYRGWSWKDSAIVRLPSTMVFPPSFAYMTCLANSIKIFPNWNAIAGATRGKVYGLVAPRSVKTLTNAIADSYTPDTELAINPITNVKPYGQCIWGNRTLVDNSLKQGTTAISFLNIRNMVSDIKKQLFVACQSLLFEQNTDVLWVNFLSLVTPTLDKMVSGFGIHNYKIIKLPNSDKTQINVRIRIYPIYAVESFSITIYLNDKGVYLDSEEE